MEAVLASCRVSEGLQPGGQHAVPPWLLVSLISGEMVILSGQGLPGPEHVECDPLRASCIY